MASLLLHVAEMGDSRWVLVAVRLDSRVQDGLIRIPNILVGNSGRLGLVGLSSPSPPEV